MANNAGQAGPASSYDATPAGFRHRSRPRGAEEALCHRMSTRAARHGRSGGVYRPCLAPAGESDLRPVMQALHADGLCIVLPETPPRGHPSSFAVGRLTAPCSRGDTAPFTPMAPMQPDVVCVPLLAFDRRGMRLGYGGGYYDRTLARLPRARTVGFGLSFQEVTCIPTGLYDVPLPAIVTEREWIRCRGDGRTW
ncbi:5-formyltetrahydrofolate cyclo-ligase [Komagataeibacter rhaeticus]|nr:5-formyltetrahydrofolate cyclo-ligase [Komagataeibacter rhaeticus]